MISYLTSEHNTAPKNIIINNMIYVTSLLTKNNDVSKLEIGNIFAHETEDGPHPFGLTEWAFDNVTKKYSRTRIGSASEIIAEVERLELIEWRKNAVVPKLYAKLAILEFNENLWTVIEGDVSNLTVPQQIFFFDATHWRRNDEVLAIFAAAASLSDEQVDTLFRRALELQSIINYVI